MEWLEKIDTDLLLWINQQHSPLLDSAMVFASSKFGWIPFYAVLLALLFAKLKWKKTLLLLPVIALAITLADQGSVKLFKEVIERYRPCHNLDIKDVLRTIEGCGGKYGFLSSHASNTASLATLLVLIFRHQWANFFLGLYVAVNMYSRVYLAKHYPSDVIAGALYGMVIGCICYMLFYFIQKKAGRWLSSI